MPQITIVYWRDIPAQVMAGRGRGAVKCPLPERFEQAIDRAAMRAGLVGTDQYLAEWRREAVETEDSPEVAARRIEADYDAERLRALIAGNGRAD